MKTCALGFLDHSGSRLLKHSGYHGEEPALRRRRSPRIPRRSAIGRQQAANSKRHRQPLNYAFKIKARTTNDPCVRLISLCPKHPAARHFVSHDSSFANKNLTFSPLRANIWSVNIFYFDSFKGKLPFYYSRLGSKKRKKKKIASELFSTLGASPRFIFLRHLMSTGILLFLLLCNMKLKVWK